MAEEYRVVMSLNQYKHADMMEWLTEEGIRGILDLKGPVIDYIFDSEEDAMAFKLRWME